MLASASVGMMDGYCQEELLDIAHDTLEMWHRKKCASEEPCTGENENAAREGRGTGHRAED